MASDPPRPEPIREAPVYWGCTMTNPTQSQVDWMRANPLETEGVD